LNLGQRIDSDPLERLLSAVQPICFPIPWPYWN
jgi:hypothetical protein